MADKFYEYMSISELTKIIYSYLNDDLDKPVYDLGGFMINGCRDERTLVQKILHLEI